jgi:hypothetical protein
VQEPERSEEPTIPEPPLGAAAESAASADREREIAHSVEPPPARAADAERETLAGDAPAASVAESLSGETAPPPEAISDAATAPTLVPGAAGPAPSPEEESPRAPGSGGMTSPAEPPQGDVARALIASIGAAPATAAPPERAATGPAPVAARASRGMQPPALALIIAGVLLGVVVGLLAGREVWRAPTDASRGATKADTTEPGPPTAPAGSMRLDTPKPDTTRLDTARANAAGSLAPPRPTARPAARPIGRSIAHPPRSATRRTRAREIGHPRPTTPVSVAGDTAAPAAASAAPLADSLGAVRDTSGDQRIVILREISTRRARLDSLMRRVESLRAAKPPE